MVHAAPLFYRLDLRGSMERRRYAANGGQENRQPRLILITHVKCVQVIDRARPPLFGTYLTRPYRSITVFVLPGGYLLSTRALPNR